MNLSSMCCYFMKDKTRCLLMAYILLPFPLMVGLQAPFLWFTIDSVLKILEVDPMDSWLNIIPFTVSIGLTLAVSIATISFMFALIVDLRKGDTRFTKIYPTFSSFILTVTVLFYIVSKYAFDKNPILAKHRILLLVYAFFLYMMSKYWMQITENRRLCDEA